MKKINFITAKFLIFALFLTVSVRVFSADKVETSSIQWEKFMSQHDMYWDRLSADYYSGAIMGNGLLGANLYKISTSYRFDVGRVDVTEARGYLSDAEYPYKVGGLYDDARLPIGYFQFKPVGTVEDENMRLSLYEAITKGKITTNQGTIDFKSYVHAVENYIVFETETTGNEANYTWTWTPLKAISPRSNVTYPARPGNYSDYTSRPNPPVRLQKEGELNLSIQELVGGRTYVVAWKELKQTDKRRIIITISQENTTENAIAAAKQIISDAELRVAADEEQRHKSWWHNYYPASFVSFADSKIESFYWTQIYKYACLTRPDKFVIDLQGPWAKDDTPWPAIWLNLNIQLTYSGMFTANRSELSMPVWKALKENIENLKNNVHKPAWRDEAIALGRSTSYHFKSTLNPDLAADNQYEVANLTWLLYYYWQYCIYNNKTDELIQDFYPLLRQSIAYYSFIRIAGSDGKYHLPLTASPEYKAAEDANYDLATLNWGLKTLLAINEKYQLKDERQDYWQDFLDNLTPYPVDATRGIMIGKGVNLTASHRHYSHLMMIYPYYLINWEQPEQQTLITKSINNWQSQTGALQGYSFTGSSAMYASMGDGEKAVAQLQSLLKSYIQPNTLYKETGPVIETPLAAVASLHDLYLQSWNGLIRVFHALPATWTKAGFIRLRAEGAFLVSATRENSKTVFIQIESEAGGKCKVQTGININQLQVKTLSNENVNYTVINSAKSIIEIETSAGDVIQITDAQNAVVHPQPVPHLRTEATPYGLNSGPFIALEGVSLPAEAEISAAQPQLTLVPVFFPEESKNKKTVWTSSDEQVLKVNNGQIQPLSKGQAIVTVSTVEGGFQAQCLVKVLDDFKFYSSVAVADSYVRGGSYANDNYGSEQIVVIKKDESAGYDRLGYFKFSLADFEKVDFSKSVVKANASFYINTTGETANSAKLLFYAVPNITWSESTLNYSNKPANGALLTEINGRNVSSSAFNSENIIQIDVADYAKQEFLKGNGFVTIHVFQNQRGTGGGGTVNLASKENEDSKKHPALSIITYPSAPSGWLPVENSLVNVSFSRRTNILTVETSVACHLSLYNISGVLIQKSNAQAGKSQLSLGGQPAGVYFLNVNQQQYKIIKS